MADTNITRATGESCAEPTSKEAAVSVIPNNVIDLKLCRLWRDNRKWLTALGCPNHRPLIEGDHLAFFDNDRTLSIADSAPGISRLVWATARDGFREDIYASFELQDGQIVTLDLQRGSDLWVSFSDSSYEEALRLAAWVDACRTFDLHWSIQGAAL